ncbi:hypothetical protein DMC30DRAFT_348749, partial [Rhodotorula diobovata]
DPAVKQILLQLDEENSRSKRFVIADLDETHVLIAPDAVERVREASPPLWRSLPGGCAGLTREHGSRNSSWRSRRTTGTRSRPRRSRRCPFIASSPSPRTLLYLLPRNRNSPA